jgi:hypothetical protein
MQGTANRQISLTSHPAVRAACRSVTSRSGLTDQHELIQIRSRTIQHRQGAKNASGCILEGSIVKLTSERLSLSFFLSFNSL